VRREESLKALFEKYPKDRAWRTEPRPSLSE
jgi:hypothetical protein